MSAIERLRVSEAFGERVEAAAARAGRTMTAVLEDAVVKAIEHVEVTQAALMPRRCNLSIVVDGLIVMAFYNGRFAGVGVDVRPSRPDALYGSQHGSGSKFWDGGPLLLEWCSWFHEMCTQAGVPLDTRRRRPNRHT